MATKVEPFPGSLTPWCDSKDSISSSPTSASQLDRSISSDQDCEDDVFTPKKQLFWKETTPDKEDVRSEPKSKLSRPYVIGVCGGTASGKTTVCCHFEEYLKDESVAFVPSDAFYKSLTSEETRNALNNEHDFDHPDSIDWVAVKKCIQTLRQGKEASYPRYDFKTHGPTGEIIRIAPADVIILEGILIYSADQELRDMMDLKIFVDCDADVRLARRVTRDVERGRDTQGILAQYMKFVKPAYDKYVEPTKRNADIIVPNLGSMINMVGVELLVQQIRHQLECRRLAKQKSHSRDIIET